MIKPKGDYDVVIVGAGNAAICAALLAWKLGASDTRSSLVNISIGYNHC